MRGLHDAGLRLHIDSSGTGRASLDTLHRFPVDAFQIDRSYLRGLTADDRTAGLIGALVTMGDALELDVIAEGAETLDHLSVLQEIGCATGQGSRPLPAAAAGTVTGHVGGAPPTHAEILPPGP